MTIYGIEDPEAQAAAPEALQFGRVHMADLGPRVYAEHYEGHITINSNAGQVALAGGDFVPISILRDRSWTNGGFMVVHELFRLAARIRGRPYVPTEPLPGGPRRVDRQQERAANCTAHRATGAHHPALYAPCE